MKSLLLGIAVTTAGLFSQMTDLDRLTRIPVESYRSVQFSSYDRRSRTPLEKSWFANEDGFGGEPIPGFEKILREPDSSGIGQYLMCDIKGPGAVVRLWTAGISGRLRVFLDRTDKPFYEGGAIDFFWRTPEILTGDSVANRIFRQFDAVYFPIPFARRCRIEWIGNTADLHFYHIGFRLYDPGTKVVTFNHRDSASLKEPVKKLASGLRSESLAVHRTGEGMAEETLLMPGETRRIWHGDGSAAIDRFSVRIEAGDQEAALRKCILRIFFDDPLIPCIEAPVGDFFGAAPGLNLFRSLPFSVDRDGTMECRFIMPFKSFGTMEIISRCPAVVRLITQVNTRPYEWQEGRTMHFRARWSTDHDLLASDTAARDVRYLRVAGRGRLVGVAAYPYNPSQVPSSWGNWWGEGDEKIWVDGNRFPVFFGTGSEDYFNYSWSSARIFSEPYCGQPRNDGPGNRGYVTNFRWHIVDDIPFSDSLTFDMELQTHGTVPHFAYGRIAYFYALPGCTDDYRPVSAGDVRDLPYLDWNPVPFAGSAGFRFIQAEVAAVPGPRWTLTEGRLWSGHRIVRWQPAGIGDTLILTLKNDGEPRKTNLGFTLAKAPDGGSISVSVNGEPALIGGQEVLQLTETDQTTLDNFFAGPVALRKGANTIRIESRSAVPGHWIGIDFIWIKE